MTHTPETLPELVDQLQREKAELVAALENLALSLRGDTDDWGSPRLKGTLANIHAALAKAKGE